MFVRNRTGYKITDLAVGRKVGPIAVRFGRSCRTAENTIIETDIFSEERQPPVTFGSVDGNDVIVVVIGIHGCGEPQLFEVADALDALGGGTGLAQSGQKHGGKDGYNSDDHGYCYEGKRRVFLMQ